MKRLMDALVDDHRRLEVIFDTLLNRAHANDREAVQEAWLELERGLTAHLEAEEAHMLPIFDREAPAEAVRVRAEHAAIRGLVADIGVGIDLHIVREETVAKLVRLLREHAQHEEAKLYQWADKALSEEQAASVLSRIRAAAREGLSAIKAATDENRLL